MRNILCILRIVTKYYYKKKNQISIAQKDHLQRAK